MIKESSYSFPDHGICLIQRDDGVLVEQNGQSYLARKWKLNEDLTNVIGRFLDAGFSCLIRKRHPQQRNRAGGVDYIGFSLDEYSPWLAVVDQHSRKCQIRGATGDRIKRITVKSLFRDLLTAGRIPHSWETAGGQHMFVAVNDIALLLKTITPAIARHVTQPATGQQAAHRLSALTTELQLQNLFVECVHSGAHNAKLGAVTSVLVNPRWQSATGGLDPQIRDIPDVLVETDKTLWVCELKLNEVGVQAAHQVVRYVTNPACQEQAGGREVKAVTVGHRKSAELQDKTALRVKEVEVELWTYRWSAEEGLELFFD